MLASGLASLLACELGMEWAAQTGILSGLGSVLGWAEVRALERGPWWVSGLEMGLERWKGMGWARRLGTELGTRLGPSWGMG